MALCRDVRDQLVTKLGVTTEPLPMSAAQQVPAL
jgi:hypothetical protein